MVKIGKPDNLAQIWYEYYKKNEKKKLKPIVVNKFYFVFGVI